MNNIKQIRTITQGIVDLFYHVGLDGLFCKMLTILPLKSLLSNIWINSPEYYEDLFYKFSEIFQANDITLENKNILEIGAGNSIGLGYFFLGEGCKSYVGGDKHRSANMSKRSTNIEKELGELIKKKYPTLNLDELIKISTSEIIFKTMKFRFEKLDITQDKTVFHNKFDLIISNAVLEHLDKNNISKAFKNMNLFLKQDGVMVHNIDLRDHFNMNFPTNFYKYSDYEWTKLVYNTYFYTNRLRFSDYLGELKINNFEIISIKKNVRKDSTKQITIHPEFKNKYDIADLETMSCTLVVRKKIAMLNG